MSSPKYLTISQAAKFLRVSPLTLRNWDRAGKLKAYRHPINNYRLYREDQILLLLRKVEQNRRIDI
jgi:site-specific DNA-methyltransferase (adenine-specific)